MLCASLCHCPCQKQQTSHLDGRATTHHGTELQSQQHFWHHRRTCQKKCLKFVAPLNRKPALTRQELASQINGWHASCLPQLLWCHFFAGTQQTTLQQNGKGSSRRSTAAHQSVKPPLQRAH